MGLVGHMGDPFQCNILDAFTNSEIALKKEIPSQAHYLSFSNDKLLALKKIDLSFKIANSMILKGRHCH